MTLDGFKAIEKIEATPDICAWCFSMLIYHLGQKRKAYRKSNLSGKKNIFDAALDIGIPEPPQIIKDYSARNVKLPLFVTWMIDEDNMIYPTITSEDRMGTNHAEKRKLQLRGCIGTLEPVPIMELEHYACEAAFHDSRFSPINEQELSSLECTVSLLHQFETCENPMDWDINHHGIRVTFRHPSSTHASRSYQATFLPGVAKEHGMSHKSTLKNLIQKAGWKGPINDKLLSSLYVERYSASKATLSYKDYQHHYLKQ